MIPMQTQNVCATTAPSVAVILRDRNRSLHTHRGPLFLDSLFIQSRFTRDRLVTTETGSRATRALWDSLVHQHIDNLSLLIDELVDLFAFLSLSFTLLPLSILFSMFYQMHP